MSLGIRLEGLSRTKKNLRVIGVTAKILNSGTSGDISLGTQRHNSKEHIRILLPAQNVTHNPNVQKLCGGV